MKRIYIALCIALSLFFSVGGTALAEPNIVAHEADYRAGGVLMKGYIAYDKNREGKRPGVLIVHEWWGISDYERMRARMLAEMGYTALAVDLYGDGKHASHPDDATKFSSELTKNLAVEKERFLAALKFLKSQPTVDPDRIAAIGYCLGGGVVLNMAMEDIGLKGVASFHGSLGAVKPPKPGTVRTRILVLQGGDDKFVTAATVEAFREEMRKVGADVRIIVYPGVAHSFTNPSADDYAGKFHLPLAYNAEADRKSWDELREFLDQALGK